MLFNFRFYTIYSITKCPLNIIPNSLTLSKNSKQWLCFFHKQCGLYFAKENNFGRHIVLNVV